MSDVVLAMADFVLVWFTYFKALRVCLNQRALHVTFLGWLLLLLFSWPKKMMTTKVTQEMAAHARQRGNSIERCNGVIKECRAHSLNEQEIFTLM